MSVRTMTLVWALDLPDSDKIVLLALADCANDEGHCWPSVRSLVTKCSKTDRTIQASIKRLVDAGHLTRREVPGKGCNYTVHPHGQKAATTEITSPRSHFPPKPVTQTPEAASDKPSRTINTETKVSSQRVVDFYNETAKRTGLPVSRVQDASLRQKIRLRLNEPGLEMILEAIEKLGANAWLRGEGRDSNWRPSLDWLMTPANLRKVLDGVYGADEQPQDFKRYVPSTADDAERSARFWESQGNAARMEECLALAAKLRGAKPEDAPRQIASVQTIGSVAQKIVGRAANG